MRTLKKNIQTKHIQQHKKLHKKLHNTQIYSRVICNVSSNFLKKITKPTNYSKYETHISQIVNRFTEHNTHSVLLSKLLKTKDITNYKITSTIQELDNYTRIPPVIDILRYLSKKTVFITEFTVQEQELINTHLDAKYSNKEIYLYLNKSPIGIKLLKIYYTLLHTLNTELQAKFPSMILHNLLINSFTSYKVIYNLESRIKKVKVFSIEYKGIHINNLLYLFLYDEDSKDRYENIGYEIIKRLLFFNNFLEIDTIPNKLIVFLTDMKKEIDYDVISQMHFKTININTAVTNGKDIIIYREQELLKSIFHELIHFHNLDFRQIPHTIIEYLIKTHNINKNNEYLLYECVTETLANILNIIFLSRDINEINSNLKQELTFSTVQVAKILNICNYVNWADFAILDSSNIHIKPNINNSIHNSNQQFTQDSCVFSYYVLKFYILLNLDTYFTHCLDSKLKFIQTNIAFKYLINIFDSARHNLILKQIINNALKFLSKSKTTNTNDKHMSNMSNMSKMSKMSKISNMSKMSKMSNTLRMTCLENTNFMNNAI